MKLEENWLKRGQKTVDWQLENEIAKTQDLKNLQARYPFDLSRSIKSKKQEVKIVFQGTHYFFGYFVTKKGLE